MSKHSFWFFFHPFLHVGVGSENGPSLSPCWEAEEMRRAVIALWEKYPNIKIFQWEWEMCAMFCLTDLLNFSINTQSQAESWAQHLPPHPVPLYPISSMKEPKCVWLCLMPDNRVEIPFRIPSACRGGTFLTRFPSILSPCD